MSEKLDAIAEGCAAAAYEIGDHLHGWDYTSAAPSSLSKRETNC